MAVLDDPTLIPAVVEYAIVSIGILGRGLDNFATLLDSMGV